MRTNAPSCVCNTLPDIDSQSGLFSHITDELIQEFTSTDYVHKLLLLPEQWNQWIEDDLSTLR